MISRRNMLRAKWTKPHDWSGGSRLSGFVQLRQAGAGGIGGFAATGNLERGAEIAARARDVAGSAGDVATLHQRFRGIGPDLQSSVGVIARLFEFAFRRQGAGAQDQEIDAPG